MCLGRRCARRPNRRCPCLVAQLVNPRYQLAVGEFGYTGAGTCSAAPTEEPLQFGRWHSMRPRAAQERTPLLGFEIIDIRRFETKEFSSLIEAESRAWN